MADWVSRNNYLSQSEMENNALCFYGMMYTQFGWTINAIAGMLGNLQRESTINPGIWEGLVPRYDGEYDSGYGLVQWTPASKYIYWKPEGEFAPWAGGTWRGNGNRECARIEYEVQNGIQWGANRMAYVKEWGYPTQPPITFQEFKASTDTPDELASLFVLYYERPSAKGLVMELRREYARKWYKLISGKEPPTEPLPEPPEPDPDIPAVIPPESHGPVIGTWPTGTAMGGIWGRHDDTYMYLL